MPSYSRISVFGLEEAIAKLTKLATEMPEQVVAAMYTSALRVLVPRIKDQIKENRSVYRGELHQRISVRAVLSGLNPYIEVGAIGVPYSLQVEKGRGPHTPDYDKLVDYAEKKMGYSKERAPAIALAIMNTIKAVGTRPHPFVEPVWESSKDDYWRDVKRRLRRKVA